MENSFHPPLVQRRQPGRKPREEQEKLGLRTPDDTFPAGNKGNYAADQTLKDHHGLSHSHSQRPRLCTRSDNLDKTFFQKLIHRSRKARNLALADRPRDFAGAGVTTLTCVSFSKPRDGQPQCRDAGTDPKRDRRFACPSKAQHPSLSLIPGMKPIAHRHVGAGRDHPRCRSRYGPQITKLP